MLFNLSACVDLLKQCKIRSFIACWQVGQTEAVLAVDHGQGEAAAARLSRGGAAVEADERRVQKGSGQGLVDAEQPTRPVLRRVHPRSQGDPEPEPERCRRDVQRRRLSAHLEGMPSSSSPLI